ncbi:MAG: 4Fe-4S binding protein [Planctomycetaceae bacterium]
MAIHALRCLLLTAIVLLIHQKHQDRVTSRTGAIEEVSLATAATVFPSAAVIAAKANGTTTVTTSDGHPLGVLWQTSPQADRIIGFSGPTNVLLAFGLDDRLLAIRILSSRDTAEHARQVADDPHFLPGYLGQTRQEILDRTQVDGVAGATLTSLAIAESIRHRLGGREQSLRFPNPITLAEAQVLFPEAGQVEQDDVRPDLWRVRDAAGHRIGSIVRGSPAIDNIIGYQGPTDVLIAVAPFQQDDGMNPPSAERTSILPAAASEMIPTFEPREAERINIDRVRNNSRVLGIQLGRSYDNEPYVGYVRGDRYFFQSFKDFHNGRLDDLAGMDLKAEGVEGVSGATMTSLAVAQGIIAAAQQRQAAEARLTTEREARRWRLTPRDWGTIAVTLCGSLLGLSAWRGRVWLRWPWLLVLVGYLGYVNGDLVSQALLVGWAKNGVPWKTMLGPLVLAAAAVTLPILTGRNLYCSHLCPHGALQQLVKNRLPWRLPVGRSLHRLFAVLPAALLVWVVFVAAADLTFSLVDLEPFDAYVPAIAGAAAITIFLVGIAASLVVPMAYCQYGCPTGALLDWLRRHSRSDQLTWADLTAAIGLALAYWL